MRELVVAIAVASLELLFESGNIPTFRVPDVFLEGKFIVFVFVQFFELGGGVGFFGIGCGCMIQPL